jgi:hypothetical protein
VFNVWNLSRNLIETWLAPMEHLKSSNAIEIGAWWKHYRQ